MKIQITRAGWERGYTGEDHNLGDYTLQPIIGRSFRSVADARRAGNRLATCDAERHAQCWVEYRVGAAGPTTIAGREA